MCTTRTPQYATVDLHGSFDHSCIIVHSIYHASPCGNTVASRNNQSRTRYYLDAHLNLHQVRSVSRSLTLPHALTHFSNVHVIHRRSQHGTARTCIHIRHTLTYPGRVRQSVPAATPQHRTPHGASVRPCSHATARPTVRHQAPSTCRLDLRVDADAEVAVLLDLIRTLMAELLCEQLL